jgi:hypothetical protein
MSSDQFSTWENDGYFVLPGFFSPQELSPVVANIDHRMDVLQQSRPQKDGINQSGHGMLVLDFLAEQDLELRTFCAHAPLMDLLRPRLGDTIRLFYNQAIYKPLENPREFPWHQDNGYVPVKPDEYITCWIALNDATIENGCIWVQPGTHRSGTLPHVDSPIGKVGYQGDDEGIPVPVPQGSVIVFSSLLLHRSGPNVSNGVRKAYVLQYIPGDAYNGRTGNPYTDRLIM